MLIGQEPKAKIINRFAAHVSSGKVEFYENAGINFVLGKREGIYMWDVDGRRLINCHSNGGVFNLGHRNPRVLAALQTAVSELDIGNHHLVSEARANLGAKLAQISPGDINHVIFGASGGEAVDMAIKLARGYTGRQTIISAKGGYHGHTGLALSAGEAMYREPFRSSLPGFVQIPFGDINALEARLNDDVAAVIFETIPATLGMPIPPQAYYANVRHLCNQTGAVMIADEVQTGLGRCGELWGIDLYDVVPDIIVAGKGLSGGIYPMSATLYRDPLNEFLHDKPFIHVSTCGGAELGCAVTLEVLNVLTEPQFLPHVRQMAFKFNEGFAYLQNKYPMLVVEVRQVGMMMGLKLASPILGPMMTVAGVESGLLIVYANHDTSVIQILPPLIIEAGQVDEVIERLDGALMAVSQMSQTVSMM